MSASTPAASFEKFSNPLIAAERGWPIRRFESRGRPGALELARTGLAYASLVPSVLGGAAVGLLNGSRRQAVNLATTAFGELGTAAAGIDLQLVCQGIKVFPAGFRIKIRIAKFHDQKHSCFQVDIPAQSFLCQLSELFPQLFWKNRADHFLRLNSERGIFAADRHFQKW